MDLVLQLSLLSCISNFSLSRIYFISIRRVLQNHPLSAQIALLIWHPLLGTLQLLCSIIAKILELFIPMITTYFSPFSHELTLIKLSSSHSTKITLVNVIISYCPNQLLIFILLNLSGSFHTANHSQEWNFFFKLDFEITAFSWGFFFPTPPSLVFPHSLRSFCVLGGLIQFDDLLSIFVLLLCYLNANDSKLTSPALSCFEHNLYLSACFLTSPLRCLKRISYLMCPLWKFLLLSWKLLFQCYHLWYIATVCCSGLKRWNLSWFHIFTFYILDIHISHFHILDIQPTRGLCLPSISWIQLLWPLHCCYSRTSHYHSAGLLQ